MSRLSVCAALVLFAWLAAPAGPVAQEKGAKPKAGPAASAPVNLNTATLAELQSLPGVGASTAKLILEHRQKTGGFKKVEELMNIKGIGEKSFLKLKPRVTVGPQKAESDASAQAR